MIKRFINKRSISVTQAINTYGDSCNAIPTSVVNECWWISSQQFRVMMSKRFQAYIQMSDAHLMQIQVELEKRCMPFGVSTILLQSVQNAGVAVLKNSFLTCSDISSKHGDLEPCIPLMSDDTLRLMMDLIKYTGEYDWLKKYHSLIPFGKQLYKDLVNDMRVTFTGRIPGKHVWHTKK